MRRFSSYGSINNKLHYYAHRESLIDKAYTQLIGEDPEEGGHYITVWAPRQTGKTWVMQQVLQKIKQKGDFEVGIITLQSAKTKTTDEGVLEIFVQNLSDWFDIGFPMINTS